MPITPTSAPALVKKKRKRGAAPKLDAIFDEDLAWYTSQHKGESADSRELSTDFKPLAGSETQVASTTIVGDETDKEQTEHTQRACISAPERPKDPVAEASTNGQPTRPDAPSAGVAAASAQSVINVDASPRETGTQAEGPSDHVLEPPLHTSPPAQESIVNSLSSDPPANDKNAENEPFSPSVDHPAIITAVLDALANHERNMQSVIDGEQGYLSSSGDDVVMVDPPTQPVVKNTTPPTDQDWSEPMDIESTSDIRSVTPEVNGMQLDQPISIVSINGTAHQTGAKIDMTRGTTGKNETRRPDQVVMSQLKEKSKLRMRKVNWKVSCTKKQMDSLLQRSRC